MNSQQIDEKAIFNAARQIADDAARDDFLIKACAGDDAAIDRIRELLRIHAQMQSFLESPVPGLAGGPTIIQPIAERSGTVIGPYKLLQQIGEGGMGVVFMAEQTEPIRRSVALKIIKPGMDTRQVIARFEAERQALAMMDHPNIAKVLDAGTTDSGRPYFVMDLVKGVPITDFCDQQHLSVRQRLELMAHVCHAVQHAHQKGIIHRDLKPANVLIAEYDGKPVPKVIDFGVAKATAQRLTERTMFTEYGQLIGTFEYMSPEQARFNQLDVDTRSDIYSLGVLLYELLAASTPLEKDRLRSAAFDEILRIINEEEPPRPSTRLSSSQSLPSIAANRRTEPARLSKDLRGELDWIVMKCLEKDRNRRYETAIGLASDIDRYLSDEPVHACPPSPAYRLKRLIRRNKLVTTFVLLVMAVVTALAVRYIQTIRNERVVAIYDLAEACAAGRRYADAEQHYRSFLNLSMDGPNVDDARRGLANSLLRLGKWNEGVDMLKSLFLVKLGRLQTPDAVELRKTWAGLANVDASQHAVPLQDCLGLDGDRDYVVLPSVQFDGRPPWTLDAIVKYAEFDSNIRWSRVVSAADVGSIMLQPTEQKWDLQLYTGDYFHGGPLGYSRAAAGAELAINEWQHVAGVWDGRELRVYVDGRLQENRPEGRLLHPAFGIPILSWGGSRKLVER